MSPRRLEWSYLLALRCSVKRLIFLVRMAIWTSEEPLSPSERLNFPMSSCFSSFVSSVIDVFTPAGFFFSSFFHCQFEMYFTTRRKKGKREWKQPVELQSHFKPRTLRGVWGFHWIFCAVALAIFFAPGINRKLHSSATQRPAPTPDDSSNDDPRPTNDPS